MTTFIVLTTLALKVVVSAFFLVLPAVAVTKRLYVRGVLVTVVVVGSLWLIWMPRMDGVAGLAQTIESGRLVALAFLVASPFLWMAFRWQERKLSK